MFLTPTKKTKIPLPSPNNHQVRKTWQNAINTVRNPMSSTKSKDIKTNLISTKFITRIRHKTNLFRMKNEREASISKKVKQYKPSSVLLKNTKYTEEELKAWYKGFLNDVGIEGLLSKEDFIDCYKDLVPRGDPTTFAGMLFDMFDTDKGGSLDFEEFIGALSVTSRGTKEEKLLWAFRIFDKDNNGEISMEELTHMLVATYGMNDCVEGINDDTSEEEKYWNAYEAAKKIMKKYDRDGSGAIDEQEFIEGCKEDSSIIRILSIFGDMVK